MVATFSSSKHLEKNEDSSTVNLVRIGETAHTHKLDPELKVIKFCGHNSAILQLHQVVKAAQGADSVPLSQLTSSVLKGIAGIFISEKTETLNKLTDKNLLDIYIYTERKQRTHSLGKGGQNPCDSVHLCHFFFFFFLFLTGPSRPLH